MFSVEWEVIQKFPSTRLGFYYNYIHGYILYIFCNIRNYTGQFQVEIMPREVKWFLSNSVFLKKQQLSLGRFTSFLSLNSACLATWGCVFITCREVCVYVVYAVLIIINKFCGANILTIWVQWRNKTSVLSIVIVKGSAKVIVNWMSVLRSYRWD